MEIFEIEEKAKEINESGDIRSRLKLISFLRKNHDKKLIELHYKLMFFDFDNDFLTSLKAAFSYHGIQGERFLLNVLDSCNSLCEQSEIIHLLGELKSKLVLPYCYKYIRNNYKDLRYRSIIVIGWVGSESDLDLLEERLYSEEDIQLAGYCATAMRQIWFRLPETKDRIIGVINKALKTLEKPKVWPYLIICLQDLLNIKLGIKEDAASLHYKDELDSIRQKGLNAIENYYSGNMCS